MNVSSIRPTVAEAGPAKAKPLAFQSVKGTLPSIEFRPVADLAVDPTYQRSLAGRESQAIVRAIAEEFDWRLCAPLVVSRRTGAADGDRFFVIDGQHRLEAARLRGDIAYLPCIVTSYASAAEEAQLFVAVNQRRRRVTPLETFRAAVVAGDPVALEAAELIGFAGLAVPTANNVSGWEPNQLGQVGTVVKGLKRHGREIVLTSLRHLAEAFPDEKLEQAGRILDGLFLIEADPPERFDRDRLFRALLLRDQGQWASAAMSRMVESDIGWGGGMRAAILELYGSEAVAEAA